MSTLFAGKECVDPVQLAESCRAAVPQIPTDWFGKAGRYECGERAEPGRAWFLLRKKDLDAIDQTTDHVLAFDDDDPDTDKVELQKLTLVRATCVSPGHADDPLAAYLCEALDRRMHLARIPIDRAFNVSAADGGAYLFESLDAGTEWTWATLNAHLWGLLGITPVPALPFTPHNRPENLIYWGDFAWAALNDFADRAGCRVKYDPVADEFSLVRLGNGGAAGEAAEDAIEALEKHRTWDAYPVSPARGRRPEKVRVRFQRRPAPGDGSSPYWMEDVTLAATAGVEPGTYVRIDDDLTALGMSGTPTNAATLADRAEERATDWANKHLRFDAPFLKVWTGFRPTAKTVLGPTIARVAFDDRGGPMRTAAFAEPDHSLELWRPGVPPVSPPHGAAYLTNSLAITPNETWVDSGVSVDLPEAGRYLMEVTVTVEVNLTAGLAATAYVAARLYDVTAATPAGIISYIHHPQVTGLACFATCTFLFEYPFIFNAPLTAPATLRLEVFRGTGTWATCNLIGGGNSTITRLGYRKL